MSHYVREPAPVSGQPVSLVSGVRAAEPPAGVRPGDHRSGRSQWTLSTEDTELRVSVSDDNIVVSSLKNPAQNWNWVSVPCEVPLPGKNSITTGSTDWIPNWTYCDATEDKLDGYTVTAIPR